MNLQKAEIDKIIADFMAQYKNDPIKEWEGDKKQYFTEQAKLLCNLPSGISVYPPDRMRPRISVGIRIKAEDLSVFLYIEETTNFRGRSSQYKCLRINARIEGKRSVSLDSYILRCDVNDLNRLFTTLLKHLETNAFEDKKSDKIISIKKNVIQKQLESLLKNKDLKYQFENHKNKTVLQVEISRARIIEFPFYYKSFEKDMQKLAEFIDKIEQIRQFTNAIPNQFTIINKRIKK